MAADAENFWQAVERIQESSGSFGAIFFILFFVALYFGAGFLLAWVISMTFGTSYWMTFLSLILLKVFLA